MSLDELFASLRDNAILAGVSYRLIAALSQVESNNDPYAIRFEPSYAYLFDPRAFARSCGVSYETERALQMMSYGPLQIMGANVRAQGFKAPLTQLILNPELAIEGAVEHLAGLFKRLVKNPLEWDSDVVAAYNAGSVRRTPMGEYVNKDYVDKVAKAFARLG